VPATCAKSSRLPGSPITAVIQQIMRADRSFASAVTSTLMTQAGTLILALITDVLITRGMGPEVRGLYALAVLTASLSVQALDCGLSSATTYFVARQPECTASILGNHVVFSFASLVPAAIAVAMLHRTGPGTARLLGVGDPLTMWAIAALVGLSMAYNYTVAVLLGQQSIHFVNRMAMLHMGVFFLGTGCIAAATRPTVGAILLAMSLGRLVALAYGLQEILWPARLTASWPVFVRSYRYAVKAYAAQLTTLVAYRADQFIVAGLAGTTELGFYAVAASVTERLNILPNAVAMVLMPSVASAGQTPEVVKRTGRILRGTLLCALGFCGMLGISCPFLIPFIYGPAYSRAVLPILLLLPGAVGLAAAKLASSHLMGDGEVKFAMMISIATAAVTALLDLGLIPSLGIAGAAAASSAGYCLAGTLHVLKLFSRGGFVRTAVNL
jgi:O-antigen/teichoic acid export membrane protein